MIYSEHEIHPLTLRPRKYPALRVAWFQTTPQAEPTVILSKVGIDGTVTDLELSIGEAEYFTALIQTNTLNKGA